MWYVRWVTRRWRNLGRLVFLLLWLALPAQAREEKVDWDYFIAENPDAHFLRTLYESFHPVFARFNLVRVHSAGGERPLYRVYIRRTDGGDLILQADWSTWVDEEKRREGLWNLQTERPQMLAPVLALLCVERIHRYFAKQVPVLTHLYTDFLHLILSHGIVHAISDGVGVRPIFFSRSTTTHLIPILVHPEFTVSTPALHRVPVQIHSLGASADQVQDLSIGSFTALSAWRTTTMLFAGPDIQPPDDREIEVRFSAGEKLIFPSSLRDQQMLIDPTSPHSFILKLLGHLEAAEGGIKIVGHVPHRNIPNRPAILPTVPHCWKKVGAQGPTPKINTPAKPARPFTPRFDDLKS
jgi:hypothetical protein